MSFELTEPAPPEVPTVEVAGQGERVVLEGECISTISEDTGFFWETLWRHPANAELAAQRSNPNALVPGDRLTIPPLRLREETCVTARCHSFRRRGVPSYLRLRVHWGGAPRAGAPFVLAVGGLRITGETDADGQVEAALPRGAYTATLEVGEGDTVQRFNLRLGTLPPITDVAGVCRRLRNLGFAPGPEARAATPELRAAIERFQTHHGLPVTGGIDAPTTAKLLAEHGC